MRWESGGGGGGSEGEEEEIGEAMMEKIYGENDKVRVEKWKRTLSVIDHCSGQK